MFSFMYSSLIQNEVSCVALYPAIIVNLILVVLLIQPGVTLKHAKEGTESSGFWFALGGKQNYTSKKAAAEVVRDPHLFTLSFHRGSKSCTLVQRHQRIALICSMFLISESLSCY